MFRRLALAMIVLLGPWTSAAQTLDVLHITVTVIDAEKKPVPVPNHALLISDDPPTATPRRVVTRADGTVDVRLRPGTYIIESDQPIAFMGNTYQWTRPVKVTTGREGVLELTAANAEITAGTVSTGGAAASPAEVRSLESDPALLLPPWQDSVVTLWTPTSRAAGFVVDARGVIATSQGAIGTATSIEVQLTSAVKVAGTVILADKGSDVAFLRIDPGALGAAKPLPLGCDRSPVPALVEGQQILSIATRLGQPGRIASGTINRADAGQVISDIDIDSDDIGGPVFDVTGTVAGITSRGGGDADGSNRRSDRHVIVRLAALCAVMAKADQAVTAAAPPSAVRLPVEPQNISVAALAEAAKAPTAPLSAYQTSSSDFDITFITPLLLHGTQGRFSAAGRTTRPAAPGRLAEPLDEFSNWSAYVADYPAVLLIRITPKLAESFWTTLARGAARTQGMSIPPIKRVKSSFARMRAYCGDVEVTPIHPFQLELRVTQTDALYEGLYAFDRNALGPSCGTAKLLLYSEKDPEKPFVRTIDPKLLEQVWQDFAPYRTIER